MADERVLIAIKTSTGAPALNTLLEGEMCWVRPDNQMYIRDNGVIKPQGLTIEQVQLLILSSGGGGATHQQDTFWAEENGGISGNEYEYSWGNGATGNIGIPCPYDGFEATALLIQAENKPTVGTAQIMLVIGGSQTTHIVTFSQRDQVIELPAPVAISKGTRIGFRTVAVTGGTWSDVRVGVRGRFPLLTIND